MSQVPSRQAELAGMAGNGRMTPHPRPLPPQTMRALDPEPVPQGPHASSEPAPLDADAPPPDGRAVWERRQALARQEAMTEEASRREWADIQRREDDERHRRGVARMLAAEKHYRDHRDAEDERRTSR